LKLSLGKIWKRSEEEKIIQDHGEDMPIELDIDEEFEEAFKGAKAQDWVDLAGISFINCNNYEFYDN